MSAIIKQLDSVTTTFSGPFKRFGIIDFGRRCTVIKLKNDDLFCLSPTPLDDATRAKITELGGKVKYLVAPNVVHYLYIKEWVPAYPDAKVIGIDGQEAKDPELKFAGIIGKDPEGTKYGFEDEIEIKYFSKSANKDALFYHKETGTILTADLLFNLPANEQYPEKNGNWGIFQRFWIRRLSPFGQGHRDFVTGRLSIDKKVMAADAKYVVDNWLPTTKRIIPCHGDNITDRAAEAFLDVYKDLLAN